MPTLLMLKGLQASGKSTYAKQLVLESQEHKRKWKRVNKDDLRAMIDNYRWSKSNEKFIVQLRDNIVEAALLADFNVVVDDTNFELRHEEALRKIAEKVEEAIAPRKIAFETKFFEVSLQEAIRRDLGRVGSVGETVIRATYNKYLAPPPVKYEPPKGKPKAILVDMDGTLAHMMGRRGPFEWDKVNGDDPDFGVWDLMIAYNARRILSPNNWVELIIFSGRDSAARDKTEEWLQTFDIPHDQMFMRAKGDMRPDEIVKLEMFNEHIRDNYQVLFVVDDRPKVCRMWRAQGLKVFQVGDPHVEF
jgi:predicted kinase